MKEKEVLRWIDEHVVEVARQNGIQLTPHLVKVRTTNNCSSDINFKVVGSTTAVLYYPVRSYEILRSD